MRENEANVRQTYLWEKTEVDWANATAFTDESKARVEKQNLANGEGVLQPSAINNPFKAKFM